MDFTPTPQVESLLERIREFNEEHVYPVEMEVLKALDEEVTVDTRARVPGGARASCASAPRPRGSGTSSCRTSATAPA